MYLNFSYNNDLGNQHFRQVRPWEALFREPWWIFTTLYLVYIIKRCYNLSLFKLITRNPRFGMLMISMAMSVAFAIADIVETALNSSCVGKNPFWKVISHTFSFAFYFEFFFLIMVTYSYHLFSNVPLMCCFWTTSKPFLIVYFLELYYIQQSSLRIPTFMELSPRP